MTYDAAIWLLYGLATLFVLVGTIIFWIKAGK
jgi:hypothetical protein